MEGHRVVSRDEWIAARKKLLAREKELTRLRDQLNRERRELPWEKVEKTYVFDGPDGKVTPADLFAGRSQLIVYHFMYGADWDEGRPSCSFWADNFDGIIVHLNHRDISMVAVSTAPVEKLDSYRRRMGWGFTWVSAQNNDFSKYFYVSFAAEQVETGSIHYNYRDTADAAEELPGISVFLKDGDVFHTYSCYARGLDMLNGAYHYMDLTPEGRNEDGLPWTMAWLRRHDQYEVSQGEDQG